jgi:hypothetical protein
MNVAVPLLGIILIIGAVVGLTAVASQNADPYIDTYGNAPTEASNNTQQIVTTDYAAPIFNFAGAATLLLAAIVIFIAALGAYRAMNSGYTGRRG